MKFKKGIGFLTVLMVMLVVLGISTKVNATKVNPPIYVGLEKYRKSGEYRFSYKVNEKIMWKISEYSSTTATSPKDQIKTFYCIRAGAGFGSRTDMGTLTGNTEIRPYNNKFDLIKDYETIEATYKQALPTGTNYNALVWILQNCYIPELDIDKVYKQELLTKAGIPNSKMTDNEIDIAQQWAIWYYTNSDEYKITTRTFGIDIQELGIDADYKPLSDKYQNGNGLQRNNDAITLFCYLIDNAAKASTPTSSMKTQVAIDTSSATIVESGSNYILGPYTLTGDKNVTYSSTLKNGSTTISHTILDSSKNVTTIQDVIGEQFYIQVPVNQYVANSTFSVNPATGESDTTIYYWATENVSTIDQPIVELARTPLTGTSIQTLTPPTEKVFDLALRKFITKINGNPVTTSREPNITGEWLQVENTTLEKNHIKTPLRVETGDTVLYTIRIYNEGEIDGLAKKITDFLPAGLKLKEGSTINSTYGWTNPNGDGKTIESRYLANTVIPAFENRILQYKDVEVECVVTAQTGANEQTLKNIAEITEATDKDGNIVTDRDSEPGNLTEAQRNNYSPSTATKGKGIQDDDDYEILLLAGKQFDLSLRKFIIQVNEQPYVDGNGKYIKEPNVDTTPLLNGETTANYFHQKAPVGVQVGDEVIYVLRVYNEAEINGYVTEITDYLPEQLEFIVDDSLNIEYGWQTVSGTNGKVIKTDITSPKTSLSASRDLIYDGRTSDDDKVLLKAFDGKEDSKLDYIDVKIKCRVKDVASLDTIITNIAAITGFVDGFGNTVTDRDSDGNQPNLPTSDGEWQEYKGNSSNKSVLSDSNYFYKGQQDDDDFDKLELQIFDLALRKFITKINDNAPTISREPKPSYIGNQEGAKNSWEYIHTKEPLLVDTIDLVEYTLRIYNEGNISGYAKLVTDDIPYGLEFVPEDIINKEYRWKMLDKDGNETTDVKKAVSVVTDYLSKEQEQASGRDNLIRAIDDGRLYNEDYHPDFRDVKVVFKVVAPNSYSEIITNIAEIADDSDGEGNPVLDRDSTPNNEDKNEDDIDVEHIKLQYFDLALRKFITAVDNKEITSRYPVFSIDENGKYIYTHTKEPVDVENGNIVTYTLRIYNEGTKAGYAELVKDDIPDGLKFLPDNETNKEYRWKMLDKDGNETDKVSNAVSIVTDYLSKDQETKTGRDNLLKVFKELSMKEPDYRDIKVAFKVTEPNTSDRIIINYAQISDDADENGNDVVDIDSIPDKWNDGEDDQDIEKIKVKYFDLALRKWVTQAIVIEDGKQKVTETGHKAEDDPEKVVKVEIAKSKLNKVIVKFNYSIRVTNQGEIAGYATEISDYIPEGLKFIQADNPLWKEADGKITTNALADVLLQPGQSSEVSVILTWINGSNNMGTKVNIAEISKDKNDSNTPDIDSIPNNQKAGEDDIDDAPVMLATKTGEILKFENIMILTAVFAILSSGVVLIKKYVL